MRLVAQRVSRARVSVDGAEIGAIGLGWTILLGVGADDDDAAAESLVDQITELRAFDDGSGRMNLNAREVGGEFLVVSQITLHADTSRGRRPSFTKAAPRDLAIRLVERFVELLRSRGFRVQTGRFGAMMDVELSNQGPVTIVLSTDAWS